MTDAQVGVSPGYGIRHPGAVFVDGEWAAPSSSSTLEVFDSATEDLFLTVAEAQAADVERAVAAARRAFDKGSWPRLSAQERAPYLTRIAEGWRKYAADLGELWTAESGMLSAYAGYGAQSVAEIYDYYAGLGSTYEFVRPGGKTSFGRETLIVGEPVGVVGAIVPWNGPATLIAVKTAPALLAGCTIVVKASPEAPGAGYLFAQICEEAGVPAGVVNVITADRVVSELLVTNEGVDKIAFTGSTATGKRIAALCGERIARTTLELGGKSPAIVLDDIDVELVAQTIAFQTSILAGQVCAALTRIIVSDRRHDALTEALAAAFSKIRVGDPRSAQTQMGPVASARQRDRIVGYLEGAKADGLTAAAGGGCPADLARGYYIEPTVFGNVGNGTRIAREEVFGPVVCVLPAKDVDEAIDIANDTPFGLNSAVFTNDPDRAYSVGRRIRAGRVEQNTFEVDWKFPGGGFKQSGIGREGGVEGLAAYLETKTMTFFSAPNNA
jgi:acyl-CoA reductase-like NAD-dependent aldehyde dehydrogenase